MAGSGYQNFRVRGIPGSSQSKTQVRDLVRAALQLDEDAKVTVLSLARNPFEYCSRVATLTFGNNVPKLLEGPETEWEYAIPDQDEDEDDSEKWGSQRLVFDTHFRGFTPLHRADDNECSTDLIAISGLGGHAFGSFKARGKSFMWLRDDLPARLPQTRILVFGYDTRLVASSSFQNLIDLGDMFQNSVKRLQFGSSEPCKIRPTILLGHSLGGLVIKEAIRSLKQSNKAEDKEFLEEIIAFLFFGVPHQGMAIEHLFPVVGEQPNRRLIESLEKHSAILQCYEKVFSEAFNIREPPEILSFYETEMSPTAKFNEEKQMWESDETNLAVLVDRSSATNGCSSSHAIARNHSEMVKFTSGMDEMYDIVLVSLLPLLKSAGASTYLSKRQKRDCIESLFFNEQHFRRTEIHDAENTCAWLFNHPQYQLWIRQPRGLLWIKGKPGAGKSVLMKFAAEKLREESRRSERLVSSFHIHGRGVDLQKRATGVYRALLHELIPHVRDALSQATAIFQENESQYGSYSKGRWEWAEKELQNLLLQVLTHASRIRPIVIFIDALDECENDDPIKLLTCLRRFGEKVEQQNSYAKVCFSSRHYPILGKAHIPTILVEDNNCEDIRQVMEEKLKDIEPDKERQRIVDLILAKDDGVFQWAVLVADKAVKKYLKGFNVRGIEREIGTLPAELNSLYAGLLDEVNEDEAEKAQTIKLFRWVLFSCRPLSILELREALATDHLNAYSTIPELRERNNYAESTEGLERRVIDMSKGLIQFNDRDVKESFGPVDNGSDRQAEFIHQSVPDYLLEYFLKPAEVIYGTPNSSAGCGHFELSRSCLRYLTMDEMRDASKLPLADISARYNLAEYATRYLFTHIQRAEAEQVDQSDLAHLLHWDDETRNVMVRLSSMFDPEDSYSCEGWPFQDGNAFHIVAALGSSSAFRVMLRQDDIEIDCKDFFGDTPLMIALRERHYDIAQELLDRSAKWLSQHGKTRTEISRISDVSSLPASARSYFVDIDVHNCDAKTPLSYAVSRGALEFVYQFIEAGASLECCGSDSSPLLYSIRTNNKPLLIKILEGNVSLKGAAYYAMAHMARTRGDMEELIRLLLEAGATTEPTWNMDHYTANQLYGGKNEDVIKIKCGSALEIAVVMNNLPILQLLLTHASHTSGVGDAFHTAMITNKRPMAELLFTHLPPTLKDVRAWKSAVYTEDLPLVKLFLAHGLYERQELFNAWEHAVSRNNLPMVEALLIYVAKMSRPAEIYDVLEDVVISGNEPMTQLILDNTAEMTRSDSEVYDTFLAAVKSRSVSMVELLLNHRAIKRSLKLKDLTGALINAMVAGNASIVETLLNHGVDIDATNDKHSTWATRTLAAVSTLNRSISQGIKENKGRLLSGTLLYYALEKQYYRVFRLLLSRNCSLDSNQVSTSAYKTTTLHPLLVELLTSKRASLNGMDISLRDALAQARLSWDKNGINNLIRLIVTVHYGDTLKWPPEYPTEHDIAEIVSSTETEDFEGVLVGIVVKAIIRGNEELVDFMLKYVGARSDSATGQLDWSPSPNTDEKLIELQNRILEAVMVKNDGCVAPIIVAVAFKRVSMVKLLLEIGTVSGESLVQSGFLVSSLGLHEMFEHLLTTPTEQRCVEYHTSPASPFLQFDTFMGYLSPDQGTLPYVLQWYCSLFSDQSLDT